jgi:hypothetical protein
MAEWTGLEPATSGVTGQHSNQLNYHSAQFFYLTGAIGQSHYTIQALVTLAKMVGATGIEPVTLAL